MGASIILWNKHMRKLIVHKELWNKHMRKLIVHKEEFIGMLLQPILWVVLFGIDMRGLMGQITGESNSYIAFIVPGIIALSALGGAINGGSVLLEERIRGTIKEYLVAPMNRLNILIGNALSTVTKSLLQAIIPSAPARSTPAATWEAPAG